MNGFDLLVLIASLLSGAIASIAGFGIGSILTPLLAVRVGTKLAVAVVSLPHFVATLLRFLLIREHLDRRVLWSFGVSSAVGGLVGALLHTGFNSAIIGYILAALLVFAAAMGLTGVASRMRFGRVGGYVAGAFSGLFGGLVGNQGGIRSAALMGFDINKEAFVATATAIGLVVDFFRMPVYIATQWHAITEQWVLMMIASVGVVVGTLAGKRLLQRIPANVFRTVVYVIILALGIAMFVHPAGR
jgi:uncharacterized protein